MHKDHHQSHQSHKQSKKFYLVKFFIIVVLLSSGFLLSTIYSHWCRDGAVCVYLPGSKSQFVEHGDSAGVAEIFAAVETLENFRTKYQHIQVFDTYELGKVLVLDGDLQITESDEENYHEMMTHVPLVYFSDKPNIDLLIIGGGDGGIVRQALKWSNVRSITLIEIDQQVINVVKKHFKMLSPVFDSDKLTVVHSGGAEWAYERAAKMSGDQSKDEVLQYDLVMVDSTDYNSFVQWKAGNPQAVDGLFSVKFYDSLRILLKKGGILVNNADSAAWNLNIVQMITENIRDGGFSNVCPYQVFQPTFLSGHYTFIMASNDVHPWKSKVDWKEFRRLNFGKDLRYYSPDIHYSSFVLPQFFKHAVQECAGPLKDVPSFA